MASQPLANRVAVVTGGTGGIGAAICKALAEAGAAVAVGYNSASEKAEAMLGELPGDGHRRVVGSDRDARRASFPARSSCEFRRDHAFRPAWRSRCAR